MTRGRRSQALLETLESRIFLSTAPTPGSSVVMKVVTVSGQDQLQVIATNNDDTITVDHGSSGVIVKANGVTKSFLHIESIQVYTFANDDIIRVTSNVTVPTYIDAGDGTDTIYDACWDYDTILGGAGNDTIVAIGGGKDTVTGGDGYDSYWVDSADTITDPGAKETAWGNIHKISSFANGASTTIAGQGISDPSLTSSSYHYANFSSKPLFSEGQHYNDVRQGALGDCYLLAALASIAQEDPNTIQQAITSLGDGTYAVRFYNNGSPVYYRMDGDLPVSSSNALVYAQLTPRSALWVALMEKAYAYFHGSKTYAGIEGGDPAWLYREVANATVGGISSTASDSAITSFIQSNLAANNPMAVGSYSNSSGLIVGSHAYMVQGIDTSTSTTYIILYNPWGVDGGSAVGNTTDGLVKLTLSQFRKYFGGIEVGVLPF